MRRTGIVILVVAAVGLWLAAPAFAQYPPPTAECDPGRGPAGTPLECEGDNWLPDSDVNIFFDMRVKSGGGGASVGMSVASTLFAPATAVLIATAHTDANGSFEQDTAVPNNARPGLHDIIFEGRDLRGDPATVFDDFFVTTEGVAPPPAPGGGVAITGTNISLGLILLAILVAVGLGLIYAGRRKKAHADQ